jgi:hypothetical protein
VKLSNVMFNLNFLLNVRLLSSPVCEIKSGGRNFSYYKISIFKLSELLHEIIKKKGGINQSSSGSTVRTSPSRWLPLTGASVIIVRKGYLAYLATGLNVD